jgi:hypothetical protein
MFGIPETNTYKGESIVSTSYIESQVDVVDKKVEDLTKKVGQMSDTLHKIDQKVNKILINSQHKSSIFDIVTTPFSWLVNAAVIGGMVKFSISTLKQTKCIPERHISLTDKVEKISNIPIYVVIQLVKGGCAFVKTVIEPINWVELEKWFGVSSVEITSAFTVLLSLVGNTTKDNYVGENEN